MLLPLIQLILFIPTVAILFSLPGLALLSTRSLPKMEKLVLATIVGWVGFTLLTYLGYVFKLAPLILIPILIVDLWQLSRLRHYQPHFTPNWTFLIILICGVIGQLAVITPSGLNFGQGLEFWSSHGHDATWHLSLMHQFQAGWPFQNPAFAGHQILNYHYFSDLTPAFLADYLHFDPLELYFRLMPLFYAVMIGCSAYWAGIKLGKSISSGLWSMILIYTTGSFGYLLTLPRDGSLQGGETIFGVSQLQSSIGNPPQIASLIILLSIIILLGHYLTKPNWRLFFGLILLTATSLVFKVYAGILILGSLAIIGIWQLIKQRQTKLFNLFLFSTGLGSLLYFPNTASSASFLIFQPWYFIRTMIVSPDRLNLLDWELKRQTYLAQHNYKRVYQLEIQAFMIWLIGNSGLRIIGFWTAATKWRQYFSDYLWLFLLTISLGGVILPLLFLQKGVAGNAIQFMQYYLLILSLFAAVTISQFISRLRRRWLRSLIILIIIGLAVPTQIGLLQSFYTRAPFSQISNFDLMALNVLKTFTPTNSVILTPPYDQYLKIPPAPTPPIWAWFDTAYVSAFANRATFLADREQVDIMGYDYHLRQALVQQIFSTTDPTQFQQLVNQTGTNFLYFPTLQAPKVNLWQTTLKPVYQNDQVEIWQIP